MDMFDCKKEGESPWALFWPLLRIFLPAILFIVFYVFLQYASVLMYGHLMASGPAFIRSFLQENQGFFLAAAAAVPMAAALLPTFPEGAGRIRTFRSKKDAEAPERDRKTEVLLRILLISLAAALCILCNAQIQAMGLLSDSVNAMQPVYRQVPFPVILLLFAVFSPFAEEFVFRGIVYTGLRNRFPPFASVFLSAAFFGLYHGELIQGTYAALMGLLFGLSMELTGSLALPWILHGISNGLPLILAYLGIWEPFVRGTWRAGTFAFAALFAGLMGAIIIRKKRSRSTAA